MALLVPFAGVGPVPLAAGQPARWQRELLLPALIVVVLAVVLPGVPRIQSVGGPVRPVGGLAADWIAAGSSGADPVGERRAPCGAGPPSYMGMWAAPWGSLA